MAAIIQYVPSIGAKAFEDAANCEDILARKH